MNQFIKLGLLILLSLALSVNLAAASTISAGITLVSCDQDGAVIQFDLPQYHLLKEVRDNHTYDQVSVSGWDYISDPGKPALPYTGTWIAIPHGAKVSYKLKDVKGSEISITDYVPAEEIIREPNVGTVSFNFKTDPSVYRSTSLYPNSVIDLGEATNLRTYRVVPLRINAFQLNGTKNSLQITESFRLELTFEGGTSGRFVSDPSGAYLASKLILNYEEAQSWQQRDQSITPPETDQTWGQYKLLVEHDGIYVLTYTDMVQAGIDVASIDPATITITNMGVEIPIWVEGVWDDTLNAGDYILFYGEAPHGTFTYENIYTRQNVYWLDWGIEQGERLTEKNASPSGAVLAPYFKDLHHLEQNIIYEKFPYAWTDETIDHWMWTDLDATITPEFSYLLNLPGFISIVDEDYDITLEVRGSSYSLTVENDHHVTVTWNDYEVLSGYFSDQDEYQISGTLPGNYANPIPNELVFKANQVPGVNPNVFYIDWFEIGYWRDYSVLNDTLLFRNPQTMGVGQVRYEITGLTEANSDSIELWNLTRNQRLTDFTLDDGTVSFQDSASVETFYFIASRNTWLTPEIVKEIPSYWHTPNNSADYLFITHENFYDGLEELESFYEDKGMTVERVKVGDLYDEFSYGMKTPQAIFDFLQYAYYTYSPLIPGYVLLVGDASWDYKDLDPLPYVDYLPTHSFMADRWGETSSDNWFVAVSANPYHLPDMYVGRFPVNNDEELQTLVDKSINYSNPPPGYWQTQVVLSNGANSPDIDAPFMDSLAQSFVDNYFPDWYDPPRIYKNPSAGNEQYQGDSGDMLQQINEGAAMINYLGHAGNQVWETMPLDTLLMLQNGNKTPFVAAFSCFTGIFSNTEGFGETFIKLPTGGAVGYWSNTSLGYQYNNGLLDQHLMAILFDDDTLAVQSLGAVTAGAKWGYAMGGAGNLGDVVEIFNLLGDPRAVFVFDYPVPEDTVDTGAPQIMFTGFGPNFHNGDFLDNPINVTITITDDNEVLTAPGDLEVNLIRETDSQGVPLEQPWPWDWSRDSLAYPDSVEGHTLQFAFMDTLPDGEWRFEVYAEDIFNNETDESRSFKVTTPLVLENPLTWPNPFNQETNFTFTISQDADVTIKVYTVSGKLIWVYNGLEEAGYNIIPWDGRDRQGDPISNGTYIYKVRANNGAQEVEARQKLIRIR